MRGRVAGRSSCGRAGARQTGAWRAGLCTVAVAVVLVVLGLLVPGAPALAQAPERERRFVYGLNLFDGLTYATGFAPHAVDTIYLLADHMAVLDPKLTEVYFWPLTSDYRADFTSMNQLVLGRLEVLRDGQLIDTVDLTTYVVQLDAAGTLGGGQVAIGEAAAVRWSAFQAERAAYLERLQAYAEAVAAYGQQVDTLQGMTGLGSAAAGLAPPPEPPPFTLYSSEPAQGFPLLLPAGAYTIRLRDAAGQIAQDSEKRLVLFGPRRAGVSVEVVPQDRWTFPAQASDPADVVYAVAGSVVYLRPSAAQEFNAEAFARLRNPQDRAAAANRWQWESSGLLPPGTLLVDDGGPGQRVPLADFLVEQSPGAALGYRIVPVSAEHAGRGTGQPSGQPGGPTASPASSQPAGRAPDLTAYRVEAPATRGSLRVRLQDANGADVLGSARTVVAVTSVPLWQLALPVVVPLIIGLTVLLWRRDQVQSARSLTAEQRRRLA